MGHFYPVPLEKIAVPVATLTRFILRWCQKRGISVASVEKEANLSNGAIRKWNKSSPTVDSLQAVAKVLKVGMEELV